MTIPMDIIDAVVRSSLRSGRVVRRFLLFSLGLLIHEDRLRLRQLVSQDIWIGHGLRWDHHYGGILIEDWHQNGIDIARRWRFLSCDLRLSQGFLFSIFPEFIFDPGHILVDL